MRRQETVDRIGGHADEIRSRFRVKTLSLFGSAARDEATEDSDADALVEFDGPASFDRFMDLKFFLEDLLGRRVDLVTTKALRPRLRRVIGRESVHVA